MPNTATSQIACESQHTQMERYLMYSQDQIAAADKQTLVAVRPFKLLGENFVHQIVLSFSSLYIQSQYGQLKDGKFDLSGEDIGRCKLK